MVRVEKQIDDGCPLVAVRRREIYKKYEYSMIAIPDFQNKQQKKVPVHIQSNDIL